MQSRASIAARAVSEEGAYESCSLTGSTCHGLTLSFWHLPIQSSARSACSHYGRWQMALATHLSALPKGASGNVNTWHLPQQPFQPSSGLLSNTSGYRRDGRGESPCTQRQPTHFCSQHTLHFEIHSTSSGHSTGIVLLWHLAPLELRNGAHFRWACLCMPGLP